MRTLRHKFISLGIAALFIAPAIALAAGIGGLHPKIPGTNDAGFGGIIAKVTPCICETLGFLVTIGGPFGGDYILSVSHPPKISVGQIKMTGGPILGSAGSSAKCGTKISSGCTDKKEGKIITTIGGAK